MERMKKRKQSAIRRLRAEFLPEALEIVEQPASPLGKTVIWIIFLLLLIFILWSVFGEIDEVALARGSISTENGVQQVQSAENGVITEICVNEGDSVHKGDVLYRLNREVEEKNLSYAKGEVGLLELRIELLDRLLAGKDISSYLQKHLESEQMQIVEYMISMEKADKRSIEECKEAVARAQAQYAQAELELDNIKEQEKYLNDEKKIQNDAGTLVTTAELELEILEKNYIYAKKEEQKYKKLYKAGAVSKAQWQEKQQAKEGLEIQIAAKKEQIKSEKLQENRDENNLNHQITQNQGNYESQQENVKIAKEYYETALLDLENAKNAVNAGYMEMREQYQHELKNIGVSVAEQTYVYENKDIVALYDGKVKIQYVDKVGAVVSATQVVAELLPDAGQQIVEAEVKNSDIGFVTLGQEVNVKIDTYNYQKYGMLSGKVIYISPDAVENERQEHIYRVQVLLENADKSQVELSPGMECSIEIKTGKRRIIAFFLEPLTDALDNSINIR